MTNNLIEITTKQRWMRAIAEAKAGGVVVKTNVNVCCGGCTRPEDIGLTGDERAFKAYAYFLSTQGRRVRFDKDGEVHVKTRDVVYFSWGNGAGQILVDAFRSHGFAVEWGGTQADAVGVVLRDRDAI